MTPAVRSGLLIILRWRPRIVSLDCERLYNVTMGTKGENDVADMSVNKRSSCRCRSAIAAIRQADTWSTVIPIVPVIAHRWAYKIIIVRHRQADEL